MAADVGAEHIISEQPFSHLDAEGRARMVNVGAKPVTERVAVAEGRVLMQAETLRLLRTHALPKGDALATARIAGVMAAKRTHELIPLCHPLTLDQIDVLLDPQEGGPNGFDAQVMVRAEVHCHGRTGVEMEALTAVSVAALTLYDMAKSVDRRMRLTDIRLREKRGGRSGDITLP